MGAFFCFKRRVFFFWRKLYLGIWYEDVRRKISPGGLQSYGPESWKSEKFGFNIMKAAARLSPRRAPEG